MSTNPTRWNVKVWCWHNWPRHQRAMNVVLCQPQCRWLKKLKHKKLKYSYTTWYTHMYHISSWDTACLFIVMADWLLQTKWRHNPGNLFWPAEHFWPVEMFWLVKFLFTIWSFFLTVWSFCSRWKFKPPTSKPWGTAVYSGADRMSAVVQFVKCASRPRLLQYTARPAYTQQSHDKCEIHWNAECTWIVYFSNVAVS